MQCIRTPLGVIRARQGRSRIYPNPARGDPGLGRGEALWRGTPVCHRPSILSPVRGVRFLAAPHSVVPNGTNMGFGTAVQGLTPLPKPFSSLTGLAAALQIVNFIMNDFVQFVNFVVRFSLIFGNFRDQFVLICLICCPNPS